MQNQPNPYAPTNGNVPGSLVPYALAAAASSASAAGYRSPDDFALAPYSAPQAVAAPLDFTPAQLRVIQQTVAADTNADEFALFIEVCKLTRLNPFARQIYAIVRGKDDKARRKLTIQTGIDGYRLMAERSGRYVGQIGPFWCGEDGDWRDVWLAKTAPVAAKVGVLRSDFREPVWAVARTDAYRVATNSLWNSMPDVMIAKCAEALAIRRAFPTELGGVYTAEEMAQADNPPTAYVEASVEPATQPRQTSTPKRASAAPAAPAPKATWRALGDADVLAALNRMDIRGREAAQAFLATVKAEMENQKLLWTRDQVLAHLTEAYGLDDESGIAATTDEADLSTLDTGMPG